MNNFLSLRAGDGFAITPSDTVDLVVHAAAIYVGVIGNVTGKILIFEYAWTGY